MKVLGVPLPFFLPQASRDPLLTCGGLQGLGSVPAAPPWAWALRGLYRLGKPGP